MSDASSVGASASASDPVTILYANWRGETGPRRILYATGDPAHVYEWFGSTEWHPEPQWLFCAFDLDKGAYRDFARSGVKAWGQEAVDAALSPPAVPVPEEVLRKIISRADLVEVVAKHFHDEEHEFRGNGFTWPEHVKDEGYRGNGGYVTITPIDVQIECREAAERLVRLFEQYKFAAPPAGRVDEGGEYNSEAVRRAFDRALPDHVKRLGGVLGLEPKRMAEGCCSAASPCSHQQRDPYELCEVCQKANGLKPVAWILTKPCGETHLTERKPRDDWKEGTVTPLYAAPAPAGATEDGWSFDMEAASRDGSPLLFACSQSGPPVQIGYWGLGRYLGKKLGYSRAWVGSSGSEITPYAWKLLDKAPLKPAPPAEGA